MLNKLNKWFHSPRVKCPFVSMSASWFLVYLIWILESKLILSNNQSRATLWVLETCLILGLLPFMIILITASLSSKMYNIASLREEFTVEEINQRCLDHQSFHEFCFALEIYTGLPELDHSDACFREELWRSDPINQVRENRPALILRPRKWFLILLNCAKLKFVSYTSNWFQQTYGFRKCTMFHMM